MSTSHPAPPAGREAAVAYVSDQLAGLYSGDAAGSDAYSGGQGAADAALATFTAEGYAANRNEVWPAPRRGASGLSPYIRHGLLTLPQVWSHVKGTGSARDVQKFRDELAWQEFARHWYARLGSTTRRSTRHDLPDTATGSGAWDTSMACLEVCVDELEDDGWLVNQTRMWMASHWTLRQGGRWQDGEDHFFRHLLDGSRAANRLGWQWTTGAGSSKPYGFSRWQVEKRAPGLCGQCDRSADCPIEYWPDDPVLVKLEPDSRLRRAADPTADAGPGQVERFEDPDSVWLTAESLGSSDPALVAHPDAPVLFVFDEPLLASLQLSAKRLIFLVETLAELGQHRDVRLFRGRPIEVLASHRPAVTFAAVPGFQRISNAVSVAELHPYPWLRRPGGGSVSSFSAWRKSVNI